jgi:hypothetical protein
VVCRFDSDPRHHKTNQALMPKKQYGIGAFSSCARPPKEPPHRFGVKSILQITPPFSNTDRHPDGSALVASILLPRMATRFGKEATICPRVGRGLLDNASWHRKKSLNWQGWQPLNLPAYSPDFNPIERMWLVMKARWFDNYACRSVKQLLQRLDQAILDVIRHPEQNQKTAAIGTLI